MVFKCQADSFLKEVTLIFQTLDQKIKLKRDFSLYQFKFESKVVICEPTSQSQKSSDGKEEIVNGYTVVLEDTILFPEGGGQVTVFCTGKYGKN